MKLARQHHPDANPGDAAAEERFKEVQQAYDVLSDPEKRKQYDRFGSQNGRVGGGPQNVNVNLGDFDIGDLGDIFGGLFGGRTVRRDGSLEPSSCWGAPTLWSLTCFALGLSTLFEIGSWIVAFREFRKEKGERGWLAAARHSKDPTIFTVLPESSARRTSATTSPASAGATSRVGWAVSSPDQFVHVLTPGA